MKNKMLRRSRLLSLGLALFIVAGLIMQITLLGRASADQIVTRSLTLQAGTTDGGSKPSGVVNHLFQFTLPSVGAPSVGSILFQYCTTAANSLASPTCVTPHGLDTTAATMGAQNGATGFTLVNTTNGAPYLTRTAASIPANTAVNYQLLGVTNPDATDSYCAQPTGTPAPSCTFFVRISTYTSTDTTGSPIDSGTVAASVTTQIQLTGTMPESLVFCTGGTVGTTSSVPDCSTATTGAVAFNKLFSPTDTSTATSQMAASTNAGTGYAITVNGTTLTSGSNTITAMTTTSTGDAGVRGTSQFGLNLKANTTATSTPAIGTEVAPASNGTNYRGEAKTGYASVDHFRYVSAESVADSGNGGLGGTDAQIFTVSYIVNVPGSQPAGTYTTTLTYICTPTF
ncbi:MAG: hypothetical protein ACREGG_02060 [Candidatus Saccharimonadales bacterium]